MCLTIEGDLPPKLTLKVRNKKKNVTSHFTYWHHFNSSLNNKNHFINESGQWNSILKLYVYEAAK